jgi:SAM-dependent methyltransferase
MEQACPLGEWKIAYENVFRAVNQRDPRPELGEALDRRLTFYLRILADAGLLHKGQVLVDLGAGMSWFGPLVGELGLVVTLVDDWCGGGGVEIVDRDASLRLLGVFRHTLDIRIVEQDLLSQPLPCSDQSVDAVTRFHSLEHWHNSPKHLFDEIRRVLRAGGYLFLATPNAVNLRKRVSVLFGRTNLCSLAEWYDSDLGFRGHVREPVVDDLKNLVLWNKFRLIAVHGRNVIGAGTTALPQLSRASMKRIVELSDGILRFFRRYAPTSMSWRKRWRLTNWRRPDEGLILASGGIMMLAL